MTFNIHLTTKDAKQLTFACTPAQTLIEAARAANITLPTQCRQGNCGSCYASVTSGTHKSGPHNPLAIPDGTVNGILMCISKPLSDMQLAVPYHYDKILFGNIPQRIAVITAVNIVAPHTMRLELCLEPDPDQGSAAEFEAGQFMELEIPGSNERRAYSMANVSNWDGRLEFFIRLLPKGYFSTFLAEQAQPGVKIMVRGPQGTFGVDTVSIRPRWLVAGGTGLAPMLSILRRMAEYQEIYPARLFFGVNKENELFAIDALQQLQQALPQLKVDLCVWKPQDNWQGFTGTPVDAIQKALEVENAQPDIYLCGPPVLVTAATKVALAAGIPADRIFAERFLPSA